MAGKSDTLEFALLQLIFNGVATNISVAATNGTTSLWAGLFTADPTDAGSTSNEGGYTQYTRVLTDRSTIASGWKCSSGTGASNAGASPVGSVTFPQNTSTSTGTFGFAAVYTSSNVSSSGMLYFGPISPTIAFGQNVTPSLTSGSSITED